MGLQELIKDIKNAPRMIKEQRPFIIGGMLAGGATYVLLDYIGHADIFFDYHAGILVMSACSMYIGGGVGQILYGKRLISKRKKKKRKKNR